MTGGEGRGQGQIRLPWPSTPALLTGRRQNYQKLLHFQNVFAQMEKMGCHNVFAQI
jgi:hypothetical protein